MEKPAAEEILDGLVTDYLDHVEAIRKHESARDDAAAQIVARLGVGGSHTIAPGVGVRVQAPSQRFDAARAAAVLTPEQLAAISEARPSVALARTLLPGALVEQCQVTSGKPSVRAL